ncbi:hypothetical protein [Halalkalicoccus jeotgali]|uniref:Uncharacterized protein n=1 Tax=Halalkalicoccus jeotgali (strain DSM 18796 / CECT 7217 / JCM 14584 / KCTC 4019 / B3) TaxID=795797 RepID=D8J7Z3_HALJB|nr:hypothetical protein [Halalkalicoccus jeotgali]ADJ14106.1 hypothetical protein HacjB3_03575 [Halalkalicoccus jeotgali B3]ELY34712.1 hypothetical protein C497_15718 [Halalkalicoccus jeotgali B3]
MRSADTVRERIAELEDRYDDQDPPSSPLEDEQEAELLRAIEELEWVLEEREEPPGY